ncbi:MAG: hypothetical protein ACO1RT_15215 [Planctomycetaceae bacterium]
MPDASLDRVLAFHRELAALSATGLPIAPDLGRSHRELESNLERINASLSLRTELGQSIEQAVAEDANLPRRYRDELLVWLRCDRPSLVLNSLSRRVADSRDIKHEVNVVLIQLLVIATLTYLAFIGLCLWTNPQIDAIYVQLDRSPDWISAWLATMRAWLPVWGVGLPILFAGLLWWWRSRIGQGEWAWLPGATDYLAAVRNANLTHHLAALLEDGLSLTESLPLAVSLADGPSMVTVKSTAGAFGPQRAEVVPIESLAPMLRWALNEESHGQSVATALRFSAEAYRKLAEQYRRRWLRWAPAVLGTLFGGMLVLIYGLSVFLPVIWLLRDLAIPGS